MSTETWYRGRTITYAISASTDGAGDDLTDAVEIEVQLKAATGDDDVVAPPLATWSMTDGEIVPRAQTGANVGKADLTIPFDEFTDPDAPT